MYNILFFVCFAEAYRCCHKLHSSHKNIDILRFPGLHLPKIEAWRSSIAQINILTDISDIYTFFLYYSMREFSCILYCALMLVYSNALLTSMEK